MGFLAWVTQEVMWAFAKKGNIEEKSDLGGRISSDNLLTPGSK